MRVVGVEPAATPRYARSLAAGCPLRLPPSDTVADGLRGQQPGVVTYPIVRDRVDAVVEVTDAEILAAVALLAGHGVEAEPSGAVAVAGALRHRGAGPAVAVVSGGNTPAALRAATARATRLPLVLNPSGSAGDSSSSGASGSSNSSRSSHTSDSPKEQQS